MTMMGTQITLDSMVLLIVCGIIMCLFIILCTLGGYYKRKYHEFRDKYEDISNMDRGYYDNRYTVLGKIAIKYASTEWDEDDKIYLIKNADSLGLDNRILNKLFNDEPMEEKADQPMVEEEIGIKRSIKNLTNTVLGSKDTKSDYSNFVSNIPDIKVNADRPFIDDGIIETEED